MTGASIGVSVLAIIIDYRTTHGADLLTTQTPDNTPTVETLRMISQKLSHLGLVPMRDHWQQHRTLRHFSR